MITGLNLPPASVTITPTCEFIGVLNVLTGNYEFDGSPVRLLGLDSASVYVLSQLTIASNITQSDFFVGTVEPITLSFGTEKTMQRSQHFPEPFTVISVEQPIPTTTIFYSLDQGDFLNVSALGKIKQQVTMIGFDTIKLRVSAIVRRSGNQAFVSEVKKSWGQ